MTTFALALAALGAAAENNSFRVTPYVQHPATNAMTVMWLAATNSTATIEWWKTSAPAEISTIATASEIEPTAREANSRFTADGVLQYCLAPELGYACSPEAGDNVCDRYGAWEMPYTTPWQYRVRLTGLAPDTEYGYRVTLEGGATYANKFHTAPTVRRTIRFTLYSDSETEPADNTASDGRTSDWTDPTTDASRTYFVTQTEAYASNVCAVAAFQPDLIVMAGDLAQKGSKQCDWDEFWRHNAGQLNDPAGSTPILASPGNHDYWSYVDEGYVGMTKYLSYFEFEPNDAAVDSDQRERFHRVDYGPIAFIFMDTNNGNDANADEDTHLYFNEATCRAPNFNPGHPQYAWLEEQLKNAQTNCAFTFVVGHQCPYSVGYHGRPSGVQEDGAHDWISGRPTRVLQDLFLKYGVDGWLCGHDEMMERSTVVGEETLPDGTKRAHTIHVYDMGIAGDGLRGNVLAANPNEAYRASKDCPEVWENGLLVAGGKHYGHLEVTVEPQDDGSWKATLDPVYLFFSTNALGKTVYGGVRHYDDVVTLTGTIPTAEEEEEEEEEEDDPSTNDRTVKSGGDIAAALATVINEGGGTVWLEEGAYSLGSQTALVDIPDGVSIQAKGARENTVIDLANGYGWALKGATAKIKGVTFTSSVTFGDSTDLTLPRIVNVVTGTLENCVFRDFTIGGSEYHGSHPVRLAADGVIAGCLFTNIVTTAGWLVTYSQCGAVNANGGVITNTCFKRCLTFSAPLVIGGNTTVVEDCEFSGNDSTSGSAHAMYGAVHVYVYTGSEAATRPVFRRCQFVNNVATRTGVICGGSAWFEDCILTNNTGNGGNGVYETGSDCYWRFDRCTIAHNTGASSGVGTFSTYGRTRFRNCLVANNTGTSSCGVLTGTSAWGNSASLENCTFVGNRTVNGSVQCVDTTGCVTPIVYNCIFWGNGTTASDAQYIGDVAYVYTSCYPEATDGNANGNISVNPLFKNAAAEDYKLNYASPCLDVATDRAETCGTLDLVGTERPQSAKGVSEAWDMGCYEMPPNTEPMAVVVTIGSTSGTSPASVTATATVTGSGLSGLVYDWTVTRTTPSGATQTEYKGLTTNELTVADLGPGSYSFKVKVTNSKSETAEATSGDSFSARTSVCHLAPGAVGVWPYDTAAKATGNLTVALENAGAKVVAAAGTYDIADQGRMTDSSLGVDYVAVVDRGVEIAGAGRDETIFTMGTNAAFSVSHAGAFVHSLTVAHAGQTDADVAGTAFRLTAGVVSNVVVRDCEGRGQSIRIASGAVFEEAVVTNVTNYGGNYNVPVLLAGGLLQDATVVGCRNRGVGGVQVTAASDGQPSVMRRCRVEGCSSTEQAGAFSGEAACSVTDCDFIGNTASGMYNGHAVYVFAGSGWPHVRMANCRIVGNTSANHAFATGTYMSFYGTNLLIAANVGGSGGLYGGNAVGLSDEGWVQLVGCTVTDNDNVVGVNGGIGSVTGRSGCDKDIRNCLFWGNRGIEGEGSRDAAFTIKEGVNILSCCWPEADDAAYETLVGCTAADPKLRTRGEHLYYPRMTGSCFNAGTNEAWMATATDLDGNPRLRYGRVDIGCFEAEHDPGLMLLVR